MWKQRILFAKYFAPYSIYFHEGLLIVVTTRRRIMRYLKGVPGSRQILGMLKGGADSGCECSVSSTIRSLRKAGYAVAAERLERIERYWNRWVSNWCTTCHTDAAMQHLTESYSAWTERLLRGESSKKFLTDHAKDCLSRLPCAGAMPDLMWLVACSEKSFVPMRGPTCLPSRARKCKCLLCSAPAYDNVCQLDCTNTIGSEKEN